MVGWHWNTAACTKLELMAQFHSRLVFFGMQNVNIEYFWIFMYCFYFGVIRVNKVGTFK